MKVIALNRGHLIHSRKERREDRKGQERTGKLSTASYIYIQKTNTNDGGENQCGSSENFSDKAASAIAFASAGD